MNGSDNQLYTYEQCREIDRLTIAAGFSELQLMGQAALASLYRLQASGQLEKLKDDAQLIILCGAGNNGGDGYALAYQLLAWRLELISSLHIFQLAEPSTPTARHYANLCNQLEVSIQPIDRFADVEIGPDDIIIDALLGVGQSSPLRSNLRTVMTRLLELRSQLRFPTLIALDVPTGLSENGAVNFAPPGQPPTDRTSLPAPDEIHSYGISKLAIILNESLASYSRTHRLPMGFLPQATRTAFNGEFFKSHTTLFAADYFRKSPLDHKYRAGHAVLVGGSPGMEGALLLSARSFFATGGGILHALTPDKNSRQLLTSESPSVMYLNEESFSNKQLFPSAIAFGPGLDGNDRARLEPLLIRWLSELPARYAAHRKELPYVVLDAGALELIQNDSYPEELKSRTLLTPHSGEAKRLSLSYPRSVDELEELLKNRRAKSDAWLLLKGAVSLLLAPGGSRTVIHPHPNPALATAGSGDVLTGILLATLARSVARSHNDLEAATRAALALLTAATLQSTHPMAEDFPELIRETLKAPEEVSNG